MITTNGYTLDLGLYEDICNAIRAGYSLEEELESIRDNWSDEWGNVENALGDCQTVWDNLRAEIIEG